METFIGLVKTRPCVYDSHHVDFKNRVKRAMAWNEIAARMGTETGNYWRFKWNCLKENYSKFKKVNANPSNRTYKKYRNWPWAEHMRFMDNFQTRKIFKQRFPNISDIKKDLSGTADVKLSVSNELADSAPNVANSVFKVKPEATDELSEYIEVSKSDSNPSQNQVFLIEHAYSIEEELDEPVEDIQVIIQEDADEDNQEENGRKTKPSFSKYLELKKNKKNEFDEVEHFFMSYAKTFKRLPVELQRILKLEMVTLFARYELQAENMNPTATQRNSKRL